MRIRSQSDFWSGVLFVAIGVTVVVLAQDYRLGTAARMGPGYFPTLLGGLLALLGLTLACRRWRKMASGCRRCGCARC